MTEYELRPFRSMADYRACVRLQEETWGEGFSERVPTAILKVGQILGGVSAGAWAPGGELAGFVFGLTGLRDGNVVHWSDMLAVGRAHRDAGLGRRLKAYQRARLLEKEVETMFWTFDPLQARNAHLNLHHLGAVVREYRENMYGDTDSPLHAGIGTDRFVARWEMTSPRVVARMDGARAPGDVLDPDGALRVLGWVEREDGRPAPGEPDLAAVDESAPGGLLMAIPSNLPTLMHADPGLARAWREATRAVCRAVLDQGGEVREFYRGPLTSDYLLTP